MICLSATLKTPESKVLSGDLLHPDLLRHTGGRIWTDTFRALNTRDNQMVRSKCKTISNRSQYTLVPSEPSSYTTAIPGYQNTPVNLDADLKFCLMKIIESVKEDINNSLKEIHG
jgi:hypothetical protein